MDRESNQKKKKFEYENCKAKYFEDHGYYLMNNADESLGIPVKKQDALIILPWLNKYLAPETTDEQPLTETNV